MDTSDTQDRSRGQETFRAIEERRAIRHFSQRPLPEGALEKLLEITNRTPSGFNLQPWHFVVVDDPGVKELLKHVSMGQPQVVEAPATVVFAADRDAWKTSYPAVLKLGLETGAMSKQHAKFYRKMVGILFRRGPFGLGGLVKKLFIPLRRLREPTPNVVTTAEEANHYVRSQTMLAAATFMIAAKSIGIDSSPMEGFDEHRLKRLLNLPSRMTVPIIIAIGYPLEIDEKVPQSVRLPVKDKTSFNQYQPVKFAR